MTTVVGGELKRTDLCAECAQESGAMHPSGFLSPEALVTGSETSPGASQEKCPACGYPLDTLSKTGRLGCAVCYEKFSAHLTTALQESQKGLVHLGKRSGRKNARREDLEAELQQLVRSEQYEEAAQVRDRIAKLKPSTRKGKTG
jgi:protein arginine kinase activator